MHGLVLSSGISTRQDKALTAEPQRRIFTKIRQGNPAKASSDAVNPKPVAFIDYGNLEIATAGAAFAQIAHRLAEFAQPGTDLVDLALLVGGGLACLRRRGSRIRIAIEIGPRSACPVSLRGRRLKTRMHRGLRL